MEAEPEWLWDATSKAWGDIDNPQLSVSDDGYDKQMIRIPKVSNFESESDRFNYNTSRA